MQSSVNPGSQHSCCAASGREKKNAPASWPQPDLIPLWQKARFIPGFFIFRLDLSGALGVPLGEFHHLVAAGGQQAHLHLLAGRDRLGAGDLRVVVVLGG